MAFLARYNGFNTSTNSIPKGTAEKKVYIAVRTSQEIPADYTDISSLENISSFGNMACRDGLGFHFFIKDWFYLNMTWAAATDAQRDIIIDNSFYSEHHETGADLNKVTHLMTVHGMTQEDAVEYLTQTYSKIQRDISTAAQSRISSESGRENIMKIIGKYLSIDDGLHYSNTTRQLVDDYERYALIGTQYSDSSEEGIDDFNNSTTGTDYATSGLEFQGYSIKTPYTIQNFKDELSDYLIKDY